MTLTCRSDTEELDLNFERGQTCTQVGSHYFTLHITNLSYNYHVNMNKQQWVGLWPDPIQTHAVLGPSGGSVPL